MKRLTTTKARSQAQERHVALVYDGAVSRSSGGAITDNGDVRTAQELFECKQTGEPGKPAKSISVKVDVLEKLVDEAYEFGLTPAGLHLRIFNPVSPLSDADGNIDLMVRFEADDLERESWRPASS